MLENKKVKIVRDTVSHRIPIGNIVRITSEANPHRGKKCFNILDYCCYVSEDDIEILDENKEYQNPIGDEPKSKPKECQTKPKESSDWFEKYAEELPTPKPKKFQKGDIVMAKNVTQLAPNGMMSKGKDGIYQIIQIANSKYWLRNVSNPNDLNEYFSNEISETKQKRK